MYVVHACDCVQKDVKWLGINMSIDENICVVVCLLSCVLWEAVRAIYETRQNM